MRVPKAMIKKWFDYGTVRLIEGMKVDPTLTFVAVALLCKFDWDALGSHDRFPYGYNIEKLSRVSGSAPMDRKLGDDTEEKIAGTDAVRPFYCEESATCGMSFEFAEADRLQY